MSEQPRTKAGQRLLQQWMVYREDHYPNTAKVLDTILALEIEAIEGVLAELESFARSHAAFRADRANTDDVLGLIAWVRARFDEPQSQPAPSRDS